MKRPAATTVVAFGFTLVHQGCDGFGVANVMKVRLNRAGGVIVGASRARASFPGGNPSHTRGGMSMVSTASTTSGGTVVDISGDGGVTREMIREGDGKGLATGDIAMVRFTGTVEATGKVFSKGDSYRTTLEDGTMISGWDTGLAGLRPGDRAIIRCSSRYGYGDEGVAAVVPPNASLVFDVELLENEGNIMNPATFADANPLTPRTPDSITEAFDTRSRQKMLAAEEQGGEPEGLDKAIAWLKSIYIFGLFDGATGQEAPWYLKPMITFPIMITICAAAFYVVVVLGGVTTERGTGVTQDDPLLSSLATHALLKMGEVLS